MTNFISNLKIKHQVVVLYIMAFFLPSVLISSICISWLYKTLERWEFLQNENSFKKNEAMFQSTLEEVSELSDRIFISSEIQEILKTNFYSSMQAYLTYKDLYFLNELLHSHKSIFNCRIYTDNLSILDNSFFVKATDELKGEAWYKLAIENKGKPLWVYKKDSITQVEYLSLVRSIITYGEKNYFGVMSININPAVINRALDGNLFEAFIEYDGRIVFSSKKFALGNESFNAIKNIPSTDKGEAVREITFGNQKYGIVKKEIFIKDSSYFPEGGFLLFHVIPMERLNSSTKRIVKTVGIVIVCFMLLSLAIILIFIFHIQNRVKKVEGGISNIVSNNFEIEKSIGGKDEFAEIYTALYETSKNIKRLIKEVYLSDLEEQRLLSRQNDIRFKMLAAQINPHFLFNTLEHIRMKIVEKDESGQAGGDVAYMLKKLAGLLRYNLSVKEKCVPLYMEVDAVNSYLEIQNRRFGDRVNYDIMIMCDAEKIMILPLLIQPLIENCVTHAFEEKKSDGFIYVSANQEESGDGKKKLLCIKVQDNGIGIAKDALDKLNEKIQNPSVENYSTSLGLVNVAQRIKIFYGNESEYGMKIQSERDKGTTVTLTIPCVMVMGGGGINV